MKIIKDLGKYVLVACGLYDLFTWHFMPSASAQSWGYNIGSSFFIGAGAWVIYNDLKKKK